MGSSGVSRIRAWVPLAEFVSENMDGWSHPSEKLEKSFSRTLEQRCGIGTFWEENTLKEYPGVLTAQRGSKEQGDSHTEPAFLGSI